MNRTPEGWDQAGQSWWMSMTGPTNSSGLVWFGLLSDQSVSGGPCRADKREASTGIPSFFNKINATIIVINSGNFIHLLEVLGGWGGVDILCYQFRIS